MAFRYKVKVINCPDGLQLKEIPVDSATSIGSKKNGDEFVINEVKTSLDGAVWARIETTRTWVLYQKRGLVTLKIMKDITKEPSSEQPTVQSDGPNGIPQTSYTTPSLDTGNTSKIEREADHSKRPTGSSHVPGGDTGPMQTIGIGDKLPDLVNYYAKLEDGITKGYTISTNYRPYDVVQQNQEAYPPVTTKNNHDEIVYDYTIVTDFLKSSIQKIKENLNIPSAFSRNELNILMNNSFNRYGIVYPDYLSHGLSGVVFFTRPDIWVTDEYGRFLDQVENDPQLYYISRTNDMVLKQLTLGYSGKHEFIPLLCNTCRSMSVSDESVETVDIGETYLGYKMQYARHAIRSLVSGTFDCKFQESYDMAVTHMIQAWCSYESSVYVGTLMPKTEYIGDKILDYACDAYLFMIDRMNHIKFFSKYYGVFPINVSKSIYSFDDGSAVHFPEQNVTFAFFHRVDLDPRIIIEFNKHSKLPYNYKLDYEPSLGHSGTTWSGPPFIEVRKERNGTSSQSDQLILRYRPK